MRVLGWALIVLWVLALGAATQAICRLTWRDVLGIGAPMLGMFTFAGVLVVGFWLAGIR